jgi:hypothetical protein
MRKPIPAIHSVLVPRLRRGYSTFGGMRRDYNRVTENISFTVIGVAAVYAPPALFTCARVGEMNGRAIPTFEISCFGDRVVDSDGCIFRLGRSMRI